MPISTKTPLSFEELYLSFNDLAQHIKLSVEKNLKIDISIGIELDEEINAYASSNNYIGINSGLIHKFYADIIVYHIYDHIINFIMNKYEIHENIEYMRRILFFMSICICLGHELGHIINGHLLNNEKSILYRYEKYSEIKNLDDIEDNLLEYDADYYCGIFMRGSLSAEVNFDCNGDKNQAVIDLISSSAYMFFYTILGDEDNTYNYPPKSIRMHTVVTGFHYAPQAINKMKDFFIIPYDEKVANHYKELQNIIAKCYQNTDRDIKLDTKEEINEWLDMLNKNKELLIKRHLDTDKIRQEHLDQSR